MALLIAELRARLPALYSQDGISLTRGEGQLGWSLRLMRASIRRSLSGSLIPPVR
jgi:hypothetical protein